MCIRDRADADDGRAEALGRRRTSCCSSTRRRTTVNRTRSLDRWERTGGSVCDGQGGRLAAIWHRTAVSCCAAGAATTRSVARHWNAAAVGSTGAAKSSAVSASEWSTCMSASRRCHRVIALAMLITGRSSLLKLHSTCRLVMRFCTSTSHLVALFLNF